MENRTSPFASTVNEFFLSSSSNGRVCRKLLKYLLKELSDELELGAKQEEIAFLFTGYPDDILYDKEQQKQFKKKLTKNKKKNETFSVEDFYSFFLKLTKRRTVPFCLVQQFPQANQTQGLIQVTMSTSMRKQRRKLIELDVTAFRNCWCAYSSRVSVTEVVPVLITLEACRKVLTELCYCCGYHEPHEFVGGLLKKQKASLVLINQSEVFSFHTFRACFVELLQQVPNLFPSQRLLNFLEGNYFHKFYFPQSPDLKLILQILVQDMEERLKKLIKRGTDLGWNESIGYDSQESKLLCFKLVRELIFQLGASLPLESEQLNKLQAENCYELLLELDQNLFFLESLAQCHPKWFRKYFLLKHLSSLPPANDVLSRQPDLLKLTLSHLLYDKAHSAKKNLSVVRLVSKRWYICVSTTNFWLTLLHFHSTSPHSAAFQNTNTNTTPQGRHTTCMVHSTSHSSTFSKEFLTRKDSVSDFQKAYFFLLKNL